MDTWHLLLYAVACCFALRTLVSLMANHQAYYTQQRRFDAEATRLEAAAAELESRKLAEKNKPRRPDAADPRSDADVNSGNRRARDSVAERAA